MPAIPASFRGHTGPTKPFSHERLLNVCYAYKTLYTKYLASGGEVDHDIYTTSLEIEREIIFWEQRSAKLRYEAKRQAARRAERKAALAPSDTTVSHDFSDYLDSDTSDDDTGIPDATRAALAKFKASHGIETSETGHTRFVAPDTSGYKKSGLV